MAYQLIEAKSDIELAKKLTAAINGGLLPFGDVRYSNSIMYVGVATGTASGTGDARVVTGPDSIALKRSVDLALADGFAPLGGTVLRNGQYAQVLVKGVPASGGGGGPITASQITDSTATGRAVLTAADSAAAVAAIGLPGLKELSANNLAYVPVSGPNATFTIANNALTSSIGFNAGATSQAVSAQLLSVTGNTSVSLTSASVSVSLNNTSATVSGAPLVTVGSGGVGVRAATNNSASCGSAAVGWTAVFAQSATITPSDERLKDSFNIPDALLDVWATVDYIGFTFKDGGVRKHLGVIAQRVKEAFEAAGLDPFEWALLCYDEWDEIPAVEEVVDEDGKVITPAVPAVPAGDRYAIRYEEALVLEAALMRRTVQRLEAKIK